MTAIYKSQRALIDLSTEYAHAINDGLIGAGGVSPADLREDSPMGACRAGYAAVKKWKARWFEIEGSRIERMRYITLRYLDRQEELK